MPSAADRVNNALQKHGYTFKAKVGEGSFGQAILVEHESDRGTDRKAIIKMIDISRASVKERQDALKEAQVLKELRHPYIVRYRENFLDDGWICIAMDYCEGGDLSDRVKKARQKNENFTEDQVLRWFTQMTLAIKYVHDKHILHRDLKTGNLFLSKQQNLKMGDFGIAKVLDCTAACAQTQIGTPYYLAPEICQGRPYAWGADVWAMGCILHELCAKRVPFDAPDLKTLITRITGGRPPDLPRNYSPRLQRLFKEMLARDPGTRPEAAEILKRPFIQDVVRKMLGEVQEQRTDDAIQEPAGPAPGPAPGPTRSASTPAGGSARGERAGGAAASPPASYQKGDNVEYYSETHNEWLPATITSVGADGRIMINVKPNCWLSKEIMAQKIRARQPGPGSARPPGMPGQSPNGPSRRAEPQRQAPPASGGPGAMRRVPSRDGLARVPSRDGFRGPNLRAASPAGRCATPSRDRTPAYRAPSPRASSRDRVSAAAQNGARGASPLPGSGARVLASPARAAASPGAAGRIPSSPGGRRSVGTPAGMPTR